MQKALIFICIIFSDPAVPAAELVVRLNEKTPDLVGLGLIRVSAFPEGNSYNLPRLA
jgi:hypothetical protein